MLFSIKKLTAIVFTLMLSVTSSFAQLTSGNGYLDQPSAEINYVIRKEAVIDPNLITGLTNAEKTQVINYIDGFGRPLQNILVAGSPAGKDIVGFNRYDQFGREVKQFLPYEAATSNGAYTDLTTTETNQLNFYSPSTAAAKKIAGDNSPFSESTFEASPLQRILNIGGVGDGFQLNQHYKTMSYRSGLSTDGVRKWALNSGGYATSNATYGDNDLTVSDLMDETGIHISSYTDKLGRIILKRQDAPVSGYYDTYYVYDNIGNIVLIVPPKAISKLIGMGGTYNTTAVPELIYQFWYDSKNRINQKKVPGAKETYIIYDPLDRIVLTQDGNMRAGSGTKWAYVKYDNANRIIIQGIYTHSSVQTLSQMQAYVNGLSCYNTSSTTFYESKQSGTSGYSNQCFPTSGTEERLYSYFDTYDFNADGTADYSKLNQSLTNEATATDLTYGLLTGTKKRILGTSTWLTEANFYDKYYHVIQVRSSNQLDNSVNDHVTNVVTFTGKATEAKQYKSFSGANITVGTRYEYDDMERLSKVKQSNAGGSLITVAKYEYNALGQLVDKKLHSTNGINYLQSVDMRYNIHGQLTSINNSARTNDGGITNDESNDVFGMEILYEKEEKSNPQNSTQINNTGNYAGMISAVKWSAQTPVSSSPNERSFKYTYDKLYRLTISEYQAKASGSSNWGVIEVDGFNENFGYDENGNIKTMDRYAMLGSATTRTKIDELTYAYGTSATDMDNQLANINDNVATNTVGYGYRNFASSSSAYTYDDNGNLKSDPKKGTNITYNELNKPILIKNATNSAKYISYTYDAAGARLTKYVHDGSKIKTIEYVGGYVVESGVLNYFGMAEGRVVVSTGVGGTSYNMEYFITDHQQNTRIAFQDDGTNTNTAVVTQENSYYAFGMQMAGGYNSSGNPNKKLYNAGSEWQDDIDGLADYYSTFYREYDAVIGRFNGVDPKSESFESWTTYQYSYNNPVNFNDPNGDNPNYEGSTEQMQAEMQANYKAWHDSQYGTYLDWLGFGTFNNGERGGVGGAMTDFEYYSSYAGMKIRLQDFGSNIKHGFDEFGNFGYWEKVAREYTGELAGANGSTLSEVGVTNSQRVWVPENSPSVLSCQSFTFTGGPGNWQEAGLSKFRFKIKSLDARTGYYTSKMVEIQQTLYYGLPKIYGEGKDAKILTIGAAASKSAKATEKAVVLTFMEFSEITTPVDQLEKAFRQNLIIQMRLIGGTISVKSNIPNCIVNTPKYNTWFADDCE